MGDSPETVPAGESPVFRVLVGAVGSALCLMPLVALARPVGLIGLPPHGKSFVGDVILLALLLAVVQGAIRRGWSSRRDDSGPGGDDSGGSDWSATHEYPLYGDTPY
jgi:hypothetical protein